MKILTRIFLFGLVLVVVGQAVSSASFPPLALRDGGATLEELVQRFARALAENDAEALRRLRVTESEYRELIVPGNVTLGEPPQILSEEASEYFWGVLDTKSRHFERLLLREFGGKPLTLGDISFEKGHKQYAGHQAWRQIDVTVTDADGRSSSLRSGSIVERDGRFKFVSFIRD